MPRHVSIGRLVGVRIGFTPGLVVGVVLLAAVALNGAHLTAASIAVPAAVMLGSLLAHELAHGLVARVHGFEIDGVVLGLTGGVVAYSGNQPSPEVDIRIAAAGPFASGLLACVLAGLHALAPASGPVASLLLFGAVVNLANAAVNLLPLPTLDGHRIAAALLARRRSRRATGVVDGPRPVVAEAP